MNGVIITHATKKFKLKHRNKYHKASPILLSGKQVTAYFSFYKTAYCKTFNFFTI